MRQSDGQVHATVPVLTKDDEAMLGEVVAMGRVIMSDWLEEYYAGIRHAMADSTTERHGVPYGEAFAEVWHFAFGEANRRLAEKGLFVNPYADGATFVGFSPFVWESSIYER